MMIYILFFNLVMISFFVRFLFIILSYIDEMRYIRFYLSVSSRVRSGSNFASTCIIDGGLSLVLQPNEISSAPPALWPPVPGEERP